MDELPDEVLEYILGQLHPYKDLERCKCVSWRWYYLVKNVHVRTGLQLDKGISDYRMQWQTHVPSNSEQRIAARYSHSAVVYGDSMFIFGGGTFEATNFNDLWRFDLSTRKYVRPLSTGSYPPPKSCATFLSHGQKLILFGGWRHNSNNSWPQREGVMLYNQLHVYDVPENKWTLISGGQSDQVEENPHEPPTLARHSATICNDEMIVFGGIQRYAVAMTYSNEVWRLNLNTYKWTRQSTTSSNSTGPSPRYGQAQLQLDENNILIVGGCGGPNNIFRDAWLLTKPHENTGRNSPWIWRQVTIKASLRCGPSPTGHVWCNPVCLIGDKLVVLGPIRANDFQMVRETNSSQQHQLVAPNDNNRAPSPPVIGQLPIRRAAPQPGPGEHHQMVNDFNNRAEEERQRLETEHENILLRMRRFSRRRAPVDPAGGGAGGPGVALNMPWGRRAAVRLAAFQDDANNNNNFQGPEMMSPRLQEAHQRLRTINRRINENQGNGLMGPGIAIPPLVATPPKSPLRVNRSNLMAMHVCDLSQVVGVDQPVITWLDPPSNLGCFEGAPEKLILYSLVVGKGELIMFGGLVKETSSEDDVSKVSNGLHFLSVPKRII